MSERNKTARLGGAIIKKRSRSPRSIPFDVGLRSRQKANSCAHLKSSSGRSRRGGKKSPEAPQTWRYKRRCTCKRRRRVGVKSLPALRAKSFRVAAKRGWKEFSRVFKGKAQGRAGRGSFCILPRPGARSLSASSPRARAPPPPTPPRAPSFSLVPFYRPLAPGNYEIQINSKNSVVGRPFLSIYPVFIRRRSCDLFRSLPGR